MFLRTNIYCKSATCPSSESLLAYRTYELEAAQMLWIAAHLDDCDFCGGELQLLTEHASMEDEDRAPVEMPLDLRCLAQSLLTADWFHLESLAETAFEKERLTLTDA